MSLFDNKKWFPLILWILSVASACLILFLYNNDWQLSFSLSLIHATSFTLVIWLASLVIKNYPTHVAVLIYAIIIGGFAGYLSFSLGDTITQWWFHKAATTNHITYSMLLLHIFGACWLISLNALQKRNEELQEKINHIADAATLHKEAELFKLRQQIQPHFLYNSLNSINALIAIMPDEAQAMVGKLSDFLRASVKRDTRTLIPLTEELEYIDHYLAIESVRFSERLNIIYEKNFSEAASIPPFLLQPVLENAIKFGLYGTTGIITIHIIIKQAEDFISIQITNPYDEQSKPASGTGFGLEGIARRLFLLYGRNDLLHTKTQDATFITTLKIPVSDV